MGFIVERSQRECSWVNLLSTVWGGRLCQANKSQGERKGGVREGGGEIDLVDE